MSLEENKQLVKTFMERTIACDLEAMDAMLADDAVWWSVPTPIASNEMTKQEFLDFFPKFYGNFAGPFTMRYDEFTAEGDRVAMVAKGHVELKNGKTYASDYHFLFTVRDGQIAYVKEYANTAHAIEVFTS